MALDFARRELEMLEDRCSTPEDLEMQKHITKNVMDLLEVFANQGHSGFSAMFVANIFDRLVHFMPLSPLTGDDDEWNPTGGGDYQNKRCPRIFKNDDGRAHDSEYWYMKDENGLTYRTGDCHQEISFPYMPHESKLLELTEFTNDEYRENELRLIKSNEKMDIICKAKKLETGE